MHTPGPWTIDDHGSPASIMADAEPRAALAKVYLTAPGTKKRDERHIANAHLIVAPPDMIAIIETTAGNIRSLGPAGLIPFEYRAWLEEVDRVIALAKGGR